MIKHHVAKKIVLAVALGCASFSSLAEITLLEQDRRLAIDLAA